MAALKVQESNIIYPEPVLNKPGLLVELGETFDTSSSHTWVEGTCVCVGWSVDKREMCVLCLKSQELLTSCWHLSSFLATSTLSTSLTGI